MVTLAKELNKAQYAGFDFNTHVDDMLARLQVQFAADFNDFVLSSTAIVLIDVFAFGLDTLSFYLDRRASDQYLRTARTPKATTNITRQLGYKLSGASPHSVDVEISIDPTDTSPSVIQIDIDTVFLGPNGILFRSTSPVIFSNPYNPDLVLVTTLSQTEIKTQQFVSSGQPNQVFQLTTAPDSQFVSNGSVIVKVDRAEWPEVEFITKDPSDQFEVSYRDAPVSIRFGDGTSGAIPPTGSIIDVEYLSTLGAAGYVAAGTITKLEFPLTAGSAVVPITINNPEPTSGGDDFESLSQARAQAPLVYRSRRVAITRPDYEGLSNNFASPVFGRVAVAQAISARSADTDVTLQNYVNAIKSAADLNTSAINSAVDTVEGALVGIEDQTGTINDSLGDIDPLLDTGGSSISTYNNSIKVSSVSTGELYTIINSMEDDIFRAKSANDAYRTPLQTIKIPSDTSNQEASLAAIKEIARNIDVLSGILILLSTSNGNVKSKVDGIHTNSLNIEGNVSEISTELGNIFDANTVIIANTATATVAVMTIPAFLTFTSTSIDSALTGIIDHVDCFLSDDCKANLVVVPVLTLDSNGFYSPPSNGLIVSLQDYLNQRKEVTQSVSVTSGEAALVRAVVTVNATIGPDVPKELTERSIIAAVENALRNRKFGDSLYESEIGEEVRNVQNLNSWTISIDGYFDPLTGDTNTTKLVDRALIILPSEVITRATRRNPTEPPTPTSLGIVANVTVVQTDTSVKC